MSQVSLFEKLGGQNAVNQAVDIFYRKVLSDKEVSHFFDGIDMDKQRAKQKSFLSMVFGGPNNYTGRTMKESHAHLLKKGLNDKHVDIIINHLGSTLKELGVDQEDIKKVAYIAESVRNDVLGRS